MRPRRMVPVADLVVFSHLRWDFVWQRPQHLMSRLAATGRRTWFVEEPRFEPAADEVTVRERKDGPVTRVWLELPGEPRHCGFGDPVAQPHDDLLVAHLGRSPDRVTWLYTPMALELAEATDPDVLVFDVMDDLASFAHAPAAVRERHHQALWAADIVFTGGRSLQRGVEDLRPDARCFPSGVEPEHYASARSRRRRRSRPVAGYVGVIDERLDLDLVGDLARELPEWEIQMVGPILKIDESTLPRVPNLRYPGPCAYEALPDVMGGFDVALMPFALNAATRSISPTKTLEYLAAGLPVVSTRVPDVVTDFGAVVDLQEDWKGFADACRRVLAHDLRARDRKVEPLLRANHWDTIAGRMAEVLDAARRSSAASATSA